MRKLCCIVLACRLLGATANAQGLASTPPSLAAKPAASATGETSPEKTVKREKKTKKVGGGLVGFGPSAAPTGPITTEIFADEASFDSAKYLGVFSGHVIVNDPRFNLQSDKLTIYIRKGGDKTGAGEAENAAAVGGEGLEKAIAEGNVAVVKETADAKGGPPTRAVGRSEKAVYTTADGNVELTGSPRVQQGLNSHVATAADTVMVLNQSGQLTTHGPSRTEIRQEPKPNPVPEAAAPAKPTPPKP